MGRGLPNLSKVRASLGFRFRVVPSWVAPEDRGGFHLLSGFYQINQDSDTSGQSWPSRGVPFEFSADLDRGICSVHWEPG